MFDQAGRNSLALKDLVTVAERWTASNPSLAIALYGVWLSHNSAPVSGGVWFNLGILFRNLGDDNQAETAFRNALARMPMLDHARFELAGILERTGRLDEAWEQCKAILGPPGQILKLADAGEDKKRPYASALYLGGRLLEAKGRLGAAENMLEQCIAFGGPHPEVMARYQALLQARRRRN